MSDNYHYDEGAIHNDYKRVIHIDKLQGSDLQQLLRGFLKDEAEDAKVVDATEERRVKNDHVLSERRQAILDRLDILIAKGEWMKPATTDNIKRMMRDVLNVGEYALQDDDLSMSDTLWNLLEHRKGDSVRITWQNLIGYLIYNRMLPPVGSPKLQEMFFGSTDDYTNIDKGKPDCKFMSTRFKQVLPLLDKYKPQQP